MRVRVGVRVRVGDIGVRVRVGDIGERDIGVRVKVEVSMWNAVKAGSVKAGG